MTSYSIHNYTCQQFTSGYRVSLVQLYCSSGFLGHAQKYACYRGIYMIECMVFLVGNRYITGVVVGVSQIYMCLQTTGKNVFSCLHAQWLYLPSVGTGLCMIKVMFKIINNSWAIWSTLWLYS